MILTSDRSISASYPHVIAGRNVRVCAAPPVLRASDRSVSLVAAAVDRLASHGVGDEGASRLSGVCVRESLSRARLVFGSNVGCFVVDGHSR